MEVASLPSGMNNATPFVSSADSVRKPACFRPTPADASVPNLGWEICDQNKQHTKYTEPYWMGRNVKTLGNLWWLQLLKRQ